jgi:dihydrofolate synthase/folylpolyglutamate synthase
MLSEPLAQRLARGYNPCTMSTDPHYQAALDYIFSFVDYSLTHQQNLSPENFDLARMFALVESLGNPQNQYPTIHVAGTKGKGSVSALCASALQAQGYTVGLYTSPHLKDFEERIQVNGKPIPRDDLVTMVEQIKPHVSAIPRLTTFEITTALGFLYFALSKVDVAVIEVGLGGRLDATNVITPLVAVITSISLDHTGILGDTLGKIAAEKAGIIKPGVPVVIAPQREEPRQVLIAIAEQRQVALTVVGQDYKYSTKSHSFDGQVFSVWQPVNGETSIFLKIPLLGNFQVENAATAYAALKVVQRAGLAIDETAIQRGFAEVVWPARFEIMQLEPALVIDSAHNAYSAHALRNALDMYFPDKPFTLIFGVSEDKDIEGMIQALSPHLKNVITTQSGHPRAMHPQKLADQLQGFGLPIEAVETAAQALELALEKADQESLILATGSLFLAASVRVAWFERQINPSPSVEQ